MAKKNGVETDVRLERIEKQKKEISDKYKKLLAKYHELEDEFEALRGTQGVIDTFVIEPKHGSNTSEAVAVAVASDWHIEELVTRASVNGLNEYNLAIAEQRVKDFFKNTLVLLNICRRDVKISTIVLALLGDLIHGNIHEENLETCQLLPIEAAWKAQTLVASGIEFLLKHTNCQIICPTSCGNHSRLTKKQRHATEHGNSLEQYLYLNLQQHFRAQKRVKFLIDESYHTYFEVYGRIVRFHHGHAIRYWGGVGGLTIPANKAIAQWDKARRADLSIFGHFHSFLDNGNFICNGSLVGYNAFALSIKAAYERPQQAFLLLDKKRWKTIVAPILTGV